MQQRLKSWESPRRQGRNNKGKGGAARQRQLRKQTQMLRKKLKENNERKEVKLLPFTFLGDIFLEKYIRRQAGLVVESPLHRGSTTKIISTPLAVAISITTGQICSFC